jgi:hypothetical protein
VEIESYQRPTKLIDEKAAKKKMEDQERIGQNVTQRG